MKKELKTLLILLLISFSSFGQYFTNETDSISEYDMWNMGITVTLQLGVWKPLGNLRNTFYDSPHLGVKFGVPLQNSFRIDFGMNVDFPFDSHRFKYYADDTTFLARSSISILGIGGIWIGHETNLGTTFFLDKYVGIGIGIIDTESKKPQGYCEEEDTYSVESLSLNFGLSVRNKVFRKRSIGVFIEYTYTPYSMFGRVKEDFGEGSIASGLLYRF